MKKFKTNEEVLASLKKANKVRREKVAKEAGFDNSAAYIAHLSNKSNPNTLPKKKIQGSITGTVTVGNTKPTIHNVHILDASGSMTGGKFTNSLRGINSEVEKLKKDDTVNYTQTIVDFEDYSVNTRYYKTPIKEVGTFNASTGGGTPLYQAIGETLERLMKDQKNGEKVLVKIFTDGGENTSSGKYASARAVKSLIKECEANGFTVTFVGTPQDVKLIQQKLDVHDSNTLVHDNTAKGFEVAFNVSTVATMSYAENVKEGKPVTRGFYKKVGKL